MKTFHSRNFLALLVIVVFVLQVSPALAGSAPDPQAAVAPGSHFPGLPVPATAEGKNDDHRRVEVTFTKWITTFPLLEGVAGGAVTGVFAGEVLNATTTTNPSITSIIGLEAVYEVQAGRRSFTALIRGGQNNSKGTAVLDGTILSGWRTGARVHVEFDVISSCAGNPAGPCFQGTIRILPDSDNSKE
jgi:hypothetical protein